MKPAPQTNIPMTRTLSFCALVAIAAPVLAFPAARLAIAQDAPQPVVPANPVPSANPAPTPSESPESAPASDAPTDAAMPAPEPLVSPEASAAANTVTYADESMSVDYPVDWQVELKDDGSVAIVNVPEADADLVDTQIFRMAAAPGAVVNANLDSFRAEGSAVSRYSTVTVDGQDALTVWLSERPDDLGQAIATFIGYGEAETIFLFSRYSEANPAAEEDILLMHSSFANLATLPTAEPGPTTEPEAIAPEAP